MWKLILKNPLLNFNFQVWRSLVFCAPGPRLIRKGRQRDKFLQTTYGHFSEPAFTIFLENPIGFISAHYKDVNSGGIKYFKGDISWDFNFSLDNVRAEKIHHWRFLARATWCQRNCVQLLKLTTTLQALKRLCFLF